jgi:hypothetical protein
LLGAKDEEKRNDQDWLQQLVDFDGGTAAGVVGAVLHPAADAEDAEAEAGLVDFGWGDVDQRPLDQ